MGQPVLLAIDDDETLLGDIKRELLDRYARHYQVVCVQSAAEARAHLAVFATSGVEVALVLAGLALRAFTVGSVPSRTSGRNTHGQVAASLNVTGMYALTRLGSFEALASAVLDANGQPVSRWWPIAFSLQRIADRRAQPAFRVAHQEAQIVVAQQLHLAHLG